MALLAMTAMLGAGTGMGSGMGSPRRATRPPGRPFREGPDEEPATSTQVDVEAPNPVWLDPDGTPRAPYTPSPRHIALQRASRVACETEIAAQQKRARKAATRLAERDAPRHKKR
jgi:hypothetical protein